MIALVRAGGSIASTAAILALTACAKVPEGRSAIDEVVILGARSVDASNLEEVLATTPSPKLMGLFRGVAFDYTLYDRAVLQRDLARVERWYRARGFYAVEARAGRVRRTSSNHVSIEIVVEEGAPTTVRDVTVKGLDGLPAELAGAVTAATREKLAPGAPFDEDEYEKAATAAKRALTDAGYAYAKVERDAFVDVYGRTADVTLTVAPDRPATFGKVTVEGLDPDADGVPNLPEGPLRAAVDIDEGEAYSTAKLDRASRALLDLGVLTGVSVVPILDDPPPESRVVPVRVRADPGQLHQWTLGGGFELDQLKTDLHLLVGWQNHDFLGGLRDLTTELRPGGVLYPTRINAFQAPETVLPTGRLRAQLRQPGFIEPHTRGFLRSELNLFPLLVKTDPHPDDPVVGYVEVKVGAAVDRSLWRFFGSLGHNVQVERPFAYKGGLDPALETQVISYPALVTSLDLRDDRILTRRGILVSNEVQIAGGPFLGDARDVRVQPEVRTYVPLGRRVTFATRASLGFLFSYNYGDVVQQRLSAPTTLANRAERVRDIQTVYFRGFFSGGSNSNRGYPIRGVAPKGVVPFLNPQTAAQQAALNCDPSPANGFSPDPDLCSVSIGGFSLWELSNEIRVRIVGPFHAAVFCDMSDVSPRVANIRLDHLHLSCGIGARYDTRVGPIRLDVGYRVRGMQVIGFPDEPSLGRADPSEGVPPTLAGLPVAIAFGIGEAY
jgi:outer membrane protein insertion porin family/translocation and assembly module TamA